MPNGFEVPSNPTPTEPSMPNGFEVPSTPAPTEPSMPNGFEVPSTPVPTEPSMPNGFEVPSTPDTPIYEVPIASNTAEIPVIDQPITPTLNVGNTTVETFNQPVPNIAEAVPTPTQVKAAVPNMKVALNTIRECEATLEKYGFTVDVEEIDFEDSYQVIFKIEK